ncbi:MAG: hypothetical protein M3N50_11570 [Pseudomonadota bacterium]|nr:hypothetical protein [Pseudomonadota bacterium]
MHHRTWFAVRLALVVGSLAAAHAKETRIGFAVGATVRAVANMELRSVPSTVDLSAGDLRRGFVDVSQPTSLVIRSNSASGYSLDLMTVTPMLSSMIVYGLDSELSLGAQGGSIVQRWQSPHVVNLNLKFRFSLAPGLKAGTYPWPVAVAVRPL